MINCLYSINYVCNSYIIRDNCFYCICFFLVLVKLFSLINLLFNSLKKIPRTRDLILVQPCEVSFLGGGKNYDEEYIFVFWD